MHDWNAIITVREEGFVAACRLLEPFGPVKKTDFFNTLVMRAADPFRLLADLQGAASGTPDISAVVSRFLPMERRFSFQTVAEFENRCRQELREWLPRLDHGSFHVRMHRRGFKGKLSGMEEERLLDDFLLRELAAAGIAARVDFNDPGAIVVLETVGPQAGLSLFRRDELQRFPLLHLD
jgi:hypothetical protein